MEPRDIPSSGEERVVMENREATSVFVIRVKDNRSEGDDFQGRVAAAGHLSRR
jgi:hypothetical protein